MSNLDTSFLIALAGAVLGGASMVLHVVAPRTKNTIDDKLRDDIDEVLGVIRSAKGAETVTVATASDSVAKSVAGAITKAVSASAIIILLAIGVALIPACSPAQRTTVEHALWDCTAPERAQLVTAVMPLADSAIQKATKPDGSIDTAALKATFSKANLLSDAGTLLTCAAASAFAAILAAGQAGQAVSALSAPLTGEETGVDVLLDPNLLRQELPKPLPKPAALRQAFDELRAAQFPSVTFKTPNGEI